MSVHKIYSSINDVNDLERISWSKLRLSAHSLAVETGRWNRRGRGRLPMEERLCQCGHIQTERHVIEECILSEQLRRDFNTNLLVDIFSEEKVYSHVCKFVHKVLDIYK